MYVSSWQEYQEAAEALYERSPDTARYCVKWRGSEGKLVLKITDNTTCLKFKTYSSIYLNRFEALNLSLMQKMQNRRPTQPPTSAGPQSEAAAASVAREAASTPTPIAPAAPGGGGVKKKKPKKKK